MTRTTYIQERSPLFWSVSPAKRAEISDILLVETILNYGEIEDLRALFDLLGLSRVAAIFFAATQNRTRDNYLPVVKNYFTLYFSRHAPQHTI